jgi:clan AA aspartic protease
MIIGGVRARDPRIRVTLRGFRGLQQEIEAVVDTGYTGWLSLPPAVIAALNLSWQTVGRGLLADGSVSTFDVYQAKVLWDGRLRRVFVDEFDATPLVGMMLLRGYEYKMQVRARGRVTIKRLPGGRRRRRGS